MANAEHRNVGIVGAGVMGFGMANNLRAAGYRVFGYDPVAVAQLRLRDIGGVAVASAREVAGQRKFTMHGRHKASRCRIPLRCAPSWKPWRALAAKRQ